MSTKLNEDQKKAIRELSKFMDDPTRQYATLSGAAGTGKSFVTGHFIKAMAVAYSLKHKPMPRVLVTAPTHKAVAVIGDFIGMEQLEVDTSTLHSALGLRLTSDGEVKQISRGGHAKVVQYDLVIVDEASMISPQLFQYLTASLPAPHLANKPAPGIFGGPIRQRLTKVLFMGDLSQLKPVKCAEHSPAFDFLICDLNEQMRQQAGNPITKVIEQARAAVNGGPALPTIHEELNDNGDGVHILRGKHFKEAVLETFSDEGQRNVSRLVAWTNAEVDKWNRRIRDHLFPGAAPIFVGERVIVQAPVYQKTGDFEELVFHTEQEVQVEEVVEGPVDVTDYTVDPPGRTQFEMFKVYARSSATGKAGSFWVLHPKEEKRFKAMTSKLAQIAREAQKKTGDTSKWKNFWKVSEAFTPIRAPYATTVHKAQGSSHDNVFVVQTNMLRIPDDSEFHRLAYVAYSRARVNLVLNSGKTAADKVREEF